MVDMTIKPLCSQDASAFLCGITCSPFGQAYLTSQDLLECSHQVSLYLLAANIMV